MARAPHAGAEKSAQTEGLRYDFRVARQRIGELLVSAKVITDEQLEKALAMPRAEGQRLGGVLVQLGMITETQLTQVLGQQLSVPWVSLYHVDFSRQLLNLVPRDVADKYCLVPIFVRRVRKQDTLYVAMDDPTNEIALAEVASYAGLPVKPMIASPSDIRSALGVYYGTGQTSSPSGAMPAAPPATANAAPKKPPTLPSSPGSGGASASTSRAPTPGSGTAAAATEGAGSTPTSGVDASSGAGGAGRDSDPPPSSVSGDSPGAAPEIEAREVEIPRPRRGVGVPMMALTLLDGSRIHLPARRTKKKKPEEEAAARRTGETPPEGTGLADTLTARDVIRALRAVTEGVDAREVLGDDARWEPLFAALLNALLKKGVVADWEFIEELRALSKPKT